MTITYIEQNSS